MRYVKASIKVGPFAGVCARRCLTRGPVHGEHVVAVDADPREAVALGALPDLAGGLPLRSAR